jgi:hypothetical protein
MGNGMVAFACDTRRIRIGNTREAAPQPDGRTREARLLRETRARLVAHVGGSPSATQLAQIDRAAWLTLRLAQFDTLRARGEAADDVLYLAWSNSLSRIMQRLGAPAAAPKLTARQVMGLDPLPPGSVA